MFWILNKILDMGNYVFLELMTGKCVGHSNSQHLHLRDLEHYLPGVHDFKIVSILYYSRKKIGLNNNTNYPMRHVF